MVKPLMMHCRASHTVDMACMVQNLPRVLYPSGRKTAHRGVAARCRVASGKTCLQAARPSGKNPRRATTARQSPLLPQTPPPCTQGPSTANGSISGEFYAPAGGGITAGVDDGHPFVTGRVGFGLGGGIAYSPSGGLPITLANPNASGKIFSATGKGGFGIGIPGTPLKISLNFEFGVAYDSNSGFGVVKNFDPEYGLAAESGLHADLSGGGQVSFYSGSPTVYTGHGTCRAHY